MNGEPVVITKAIRAWRNGGVEGLGAAGRRWLNRRLGPEPQDLALAPADIVQSPAALQGDCTLPNGGSYSIGWVLTPPSGGSGGHTTAFRMIQALERKGHRCEIWLYAGRGSVPEDAERVIREWWPDVRADVKPVPESAKGFHAVVATAWQTAHVVARFTEPARRVYFAQDYEPWFYGQGVASELARATYDFGFDILTVGRAVADKIYDAHGVEPVVVPYGCDHEVYRADLHSQRDAVVFYSRPGVARRGYELGVAALEIFHRERPEVPIHSIGTMAGRAPFPVTVHPTLSPSQLNALYRRCAAGLVLSFTNVSLVPFELLAAGVVPVLNDWRYSRLDLHGDHVVWSPPTPRKLAEGLVAGIELQQTAGAASVASDASHLDWRSSGDRFAAALEEVLSGSPSAASMSRAEGLNA
ncbi:rhamnosyltransferase WsaF family glycosyltransferase [Sinomonas humi]|uniref:rhamnosyltransferase WsaF family glycosyltransferase n=1 Tax=Sinomonas humi TaxID=1338436 RepID=UPI00068B3568|nr:glycosyltransferase family 4 protein [Sinomonas humi]